jgi:hypothetical protein
VFPDLLLSHQDRLTHSTRPSWGGVQCVLGDFERVGVQVHDAARRTVVLDTLWTRDVEKQGGTAATLDR